MKDKVKRFPATGDGTICGPKLNKSLEEYKLTSKTLKHTEDVTNGTSSSKSFSGWPAGSGGRKRGSGTQGGPPRKHFKLNVPNQLNSGSSSSYSRGSGSSGYTYNRVHKGGNNSYGGRGGH